MQGVYADGVLRGYVKIFRDMTERNRQRNAGLCRSGSCLSPLPAVPTMPGHTRRIECLQETTDQLQNIKQFLPFDIEGKQFIQSSRRTQFPKTLCL